MKFLNSLTVKEPRSSQLRALPQSSSPSPPLSRSRVQHSSANVIRTFFQTIKHKATNQRGGNNKLSPSTEEDDVIYIPTFRKHERSRGRALIKTIGNKTASMFKRQKIPSFEILYRNDGDIAIVDTNEDEAQKPYAPETGKACIDQTSNAFVSSLMYQHPSATVGTPNKTIVTIPSGSLVAKFDYSPFSDVAAQTLKSAKSTRSIKSIEGVLSLSTYDSHLQISTSESLVPATSLFRASISIMSSLGSPLNSADFDAAFEAIFGIKSA